MKSTSTARELLDTGSSWAEHRLADRVEKVLALHHEDPEPTWRGETTCAYCHDEDGELNRWPCPTVRLLNGEDV